MIGTEFSLDLCQHITDESVYVKYQEGLQPVDLGDAVSMWLDRIIEAVSLRIPLNGTEIEIEANPANERVIVTYTLNETKFECIRGFEDIADLVGEPVMASVTVKW